MDKRNIESIFPLTPLQTAFLFRGASSDADPGIVQPCFTLQGELSKAVFDEALDWLIQQHPVLRTSVHWKDLKKPLQVVNRQCEFKADYVASESALHIDNSLDLTQAPVMKIAIYQSAARQYKMRWLCHHLLLDSWSQSILFQQLLDIYHALSEGKAKPRLSVIPFQDWVKFLGSIDKQEEEKYWIKNLSHITPDTRFWNISQPSSDFNKLSIVLDENTTKKIYSFARKNQTTIGILMQLVWGLALAHIKQITQVVLGVAVSGRVSTFQQVDMMVGMFSNSLPLSIDLSEEKKLVDVMKSIQNQLSARSMYETTPLSDMYEWGVIKTPQPFDTLLVVENFPWETNRKNDTKLTVTDVKGSITNHYPISLVVFPDDEMRLEIFYMNDLLDDFNANNILELCRQLLFEMMIDVEVTTATLLRKRQLPTIAYSRSSKKNHVSIASPIVKHQKGDRKTIQALKSIWMQTLKLDDINIDDNFFELGGNSFSGLSLINKINSHLGKQLPLLTLYQAPTVSSMANLIGNELHRIENTRLIPMNTQGDCTPFFLVNGEKMMAPILTSYLKKKQPFYIVEGHWERSDITPATTMKQLAEQAINDMRVVNQSKVWRIGGYSFGAILAYEIAQQLMSQGEKIELLFLLDPTTDSSDFAMINDGANVIASTKTRPSSSTAPPISRVRNKIEKFLNKGSSKKTPSIFKELRGIVAYRTLLYRTKVTRYASIHISHQLIKRGKTVSSSFRRSYAANIYASICSRYTLVSYQGDIILFAGNLYPKNNIWSSLSNERCEITEFETNHEGFSDSLEIIHQWSKTLSEKLNKL